jgi:hypothetical protein
VALVIGFLLLVTGPHPPPFGKESAGAPTIPIPGPAPRALVGVGLLGIVVGTAGIAGSRWRVPVAGTDDQAVVPRAADAAAYGGLVAASTALAAMIVIQFAWPAIVRGAGAGPCDQSATATCFSAHPDFYQELPPGSGHFTTPASRFSDAALLPVSQAAWPLALGAAATSLIAIASGTRRRRAAVIGVVLGSIAVVVMATAYLGVVPDP